MSITNLDRYATRMLIALGFSPKNIGFHYIRQALILTAEDPAWLELITKNLYPTLAHEFHSKSEDVERAMRFAIQDWYTDKSPGAQIQAAEAGVITVPNRCPSNLSLLKLLSTPLQNVHI